MSDTSETLELVIQELQNRLGQIMSQYEIQIAVLKASITKELEAKDKLIEELTAKTASSKVSAKGETA